MSQTTGYLLLLFIAALALGVVTGTDWLTADLFERAEW